MYFYMCWIVFMMRTAFCSNHPPHKHFEESIARPLQIRPKKVEKTNIFLHFLDGFCDAHCML